MIKQASQSHNKQNRARRKDFLYKVAKLHQNNLMHRADSQQNYHPEEYPTHPQQPDEAVDTDDFQLCMPPHNWQADGYEEEIEIMDFSTQLGFSQQEGAKQNNKCERNLIQKHVIKTQLQSSHPTAFVFDEQQQIERQPLSTTQHAQLQSQNLDKTQVQKQPQQQQQSQQIQQLKGVTISSNHLDGNIIIKIIDKKQLIQSRLPPGIILRCILRRSRDIFNPEFDFYLNNGMKHLLSARKNSLAKKQIFNVSLQMGKYKGSDLVGVIMANTAHNIYWLYQQEEVNEQIENQVKAIIQYHKDINPGFREMKVKLRTEAGKQTNPEAKRMGDVPELVLKSEQYSQKQNSVKNYVLFDEEDKEYEYLKMKKVSDNMFEVEIQHPLSPFQAFAISLTRFDAELK